MPTATPAPKPLPTRHQELDLYRRLVNGDHTAPADLAAALFDPLIQWLIAGNRKVEKDMCGEAAAEACCAFIKNPESYKVHHEKAVGLFAFLQMSAKRDLQNLLRKEGRHHRLRVSLESVEQSPDAGKYIGREDDPALPVLIQEEVEVAAVQVLPLVREGLTDAELRVLDLMLTQEKKTAVYAEAFGIGHLPFHQQRAEVKRVRDKLQQRLKRARAGHEQSS